MNDIQLKPQQLQALQMITTGRPVHEICNELGINKATFHRWRKDPRFIAAYNSFFLQYMESAKTRLQGLVWNAVTVLDYHLKQNNLRAATELLKITGLYTDIPKPDTETDPGAVLKRQLETDVEKILADTPFRKENEEIDRVKYRKLLVQECRRQYEAKLKELELPFLHFGNIDDNPRLNNA